MVAFLQRQPQPSDLHCTGEDAEGIVTSSGEHRWSLRCQSSDLTEREVIVSLRLPRGEEVDQKEERRTRQGDVEEGKRELLLKQLCNP